MKFTGFLLTLLGVVVLAAGLFVFDLNDQYSLASMFDMLDSGLEQLNMSLDDLEEVISWIPVLVPQLDDALTAIMGEDAELTPSMVRVAMFAVKHRMALAIGGGAMMLLGNLCALLAPRRRR